MGLLEISCRFTAPVRIDDTIRVRQTVGETRATSKPDRGIVSFTLEVLNQRDEVVIAASEKVLVRRRG